MLVLELDLFNLLRARIGIQIILLGTLFILGCSDAPEAVQRVQLNTTAAEHAEFSRDGVLALSSGAQVGIYDQSGDMLDMVSLGTPEGIWRVKWQSAEYLWVYDRRRLLHYSIKGQTLTQSLAFTALNIRTITPTDSGLVIATEASELLWLGVEVKDDSLQSADEAEVIDTLSRSIQHIGTLHQDSGSPQLLYAATSDGLVHTWSLPDLIRQEQWQLNKAVQGVFSAPEGAYWVVLNRTANPLASQNRLSLVLMPEQGTMQRQQLSDDFSIRSLFKSEDTLIMGGSNNRWMSFNTLEGTSRSGQYGSARNPLRQSTITAIYVNNDKVYMITSRGELQIWEKTRIF